MSGKLKPRPRPPIRGDEDSSEAAGGSSDEETMDQAMRAWDAQGLHTRPFLGLASIGKKKKGTPMSNARSQSSTPILVTEDNAAAFTLEDTNLTDDAFAASAANYFQYLERQQNSSAAVAAPAAAAGQVDAWQKRLDGALAKLQVLVPAAADSRVQWPAHDGTIIPWSQSAVYQRLDLKCQQLAYALGRPTPSTDLTFAAYWHAAARPPWPAVSAPETSRPAMPMGALMTVCVSFSLGRPAAATWILF